MCSRRSPKILAPPCDLAGKLILEQSGTHLRNPGCNKPANQKRITGAHRMMRIRRYLCIAVSLVVGFNAGLGQSVERITADAVKPHVLKLADDSMEGRGGGYKGEQMAARYIADQFKKVGLKPVGTKGYFQEFQFQPY